MKTMKGHVVMIHLKPVMPMKSEIARNSPIAQYVAPEESMYLTNHDLRPCFHTMTSVISHKSIMIMFSGKLKIGI